MIQTEDGSTTCLKWLLSLGPHIICLLFSSSNKKAHIVHSHNDTFTKQKIPKNYFVEARSLVVLILMTSISFYYLLISLSLYDSFVLEYVVADADYESMGKGVIFCLKLS